MKHDVLREEETGGQTVVLIAEDFEDVAELKDIRIKVEGNGVELELTKTSAKLKIPLRLRAQYVKGGKGKKDRAEEKDETPADKPETQIANAFASSDSEPG